MIKITLLFVGAVFVSKSSYADSRIVYGRDSRVDVNKIYNPKIKALSKSVAARVSNFSFKPKGPSNELLEFLNILPASDKRAINLCKGEKFSDQPIMSDCTGFLISDTHFVTAGHCVVGPGETVENDMTFSCEGHSWVFDYVDHKNIENELKNFDSEKVYGCKKVVYATWQPELDFAIIELDRKTTGRTPLKLSQNSVRVNDKLFVMGHPSGLPMKLSFGATVFDIEEDYFTTNLDSFSGNSGSPVINKTTLEVEGILVRGDVDYVEHINEDGSICMKVNTCKNDRSSCDEDDPGITGEHVTHISKVLEYIK